MGGTTAKGWPYVTPDDHPLQYPAASQALANALNSGVALRIASAIKGSDQSGIASGGSAGFTASLSSVPTGVTVLGIINHQGGGGTAGTHFVAPVLTGGTISGSDLGGTNYGPAGQAIQIVTFHVITATAATVTLGYTMSGGGTWTVNRRSSIYLIVI